MVKVKYKNPGLEFIVITVNVITCMVITSTFVLLYGLDSLPAPITVRMLHFVQITAFLILVGEKTIRFSNAFFKKQYLQAYWYEIPLLLMLMVAVFTSEKLFATETPGAPIMLVLDIYLITQVIIKICRSCVDAASSGRNPMRALIMIFLILILTGAGMLMLPRSHNLDHMSFIDALFTATSATCVTGLIVADTGTDFTVMGQIIILSLIQLGGLGIVIFGAVIALLLGQALNVKESVAMQDLLSTRTLGKIGNMIGFIIITTLTIEAVGAMLMYGIWHNIPGTVNDQNAQWFCSIFHSISAFCNAGFSLYADSLIPTSRSWAVYGVICPLIILGGLGFSVLFNLFDVICDRFRWFIDRKRSHTVFETAPPKKISLQSKIVLLASLALIVIGTISLMLLEHHSVTNQSDNLLASSFFQSVTARTAGFNTVKIESLSHASQLMLVLLMVIGGSPGSTAGGIKTITLVILIMIAYSSLRKRPSVEIFKRTIPLAIVGRTVTVALLYAAALILVIFVLNITEAHNRFGQMDIIFESASALGTVGLTTGITSSLTTAGKAVIIFAMLIGRLGPLSLLAALMVNIKPTKYDYPTEAVVVG